MIITITTNVKIDSDDYESFRVLCIKRKQKAGEVIGNLITAEVKKNVRLLKGESA